MATLPQDYYYYLTNNTKKGEYGRFKLSTKMKSIFNAFEGFFVDSGGCEGILIRLVIKYCLKLL